MRTLLVRWAVIMIAVLLVNWALPPLLGLSDPIFRYGDWGTLALFAVVLALLNTFIRPILKLLALPISCLTLGLFSIVINAALFALAAAIVPGFNSGGILGALAGAVAVSLVGVAMNTFLPGAR